MQAIVKTLVCLSFGIISLSAYRSVIVALRTDRVLSVENGFAILELFIGLGLLYSAFFKSEWLGKLIFTMMITVSLDFSSQGFNEFPISVLLGFGPHYVKVVGAEAVQGFFTRYELVFASSLMLISALVIKFRYKSHNKSSHSPH